MSVDITMQPFQQEIADSILEAPIVATLTHEGQFARPEETQSDAEHGESVFDDPIELLNEGLEDSKDNADLFHVIARREEEQSAEDSERERQEKLVLSPEERIMRRMEREDREPVETQETQQEALEQQPAQALTPQQVEQGVQALDSTVKQYGFNDEESRRAVAAGFCESLGTDIDRAEINVEAFGNMWAKTALSTHQIYDAVGGDLSKLPPIPGLSAQAWMHDFLTSCNVDPRTVNADAGYAARTVQMGFSNILKTIDDLGGNATDVRRINHSPEAAEFFYGHFIKAMTGVDASKLPDFRKHALKFADTATNYAVQFRQKYRQAQQSERNAASKQPRGKSRVPARFREGLKGSKAPVFESNRDVFSPAVVEAATSRNL